MGTASFIDPLVVLADPPLSRRLATQPDATKFRFGIASLANDGGIIEVIDGREIIIDVSEHDGERFVAVGLAGPSAAAFDQIFPDGTEPSEENLVQAVKTYLDKATPPDAAAPAAQPDDPPETPAPDNSWFCKLHPRDQRCKKK